MKQQLVKYYSLENPEQVIVAKNKLSKRPIILKTNAGRMVFDSQEEKEHYLRGRAKTTKCRCHHFIGGSICMYRNCRHSIEEHYS
jgi:hypothetical protein